MGVLLLQFRKMNLIQKQNNLEFQAVDLNQQLTDLQSAGTILASDTISPSDLASLPASLFGFGLGTLANNHAQATQYANQRMTELTGGSIFTQFGDNAAQMQQITYMKLYEQAQEQLKKRLQAQLNQKEKEINNKKTRIESQASMVDKELEKIDERLAKAIDRSVCGFGVGS